MTSPWKHLPSMWEMRVQSLGMEDPLEKEMTTHSSTLAWKIPQEEKHGKLQFKGSQRVGHDRATSLSFLPFIKSVGYLGSIVILTISILPARSQCSFSSVCVTCSLFCQHGIVLGVPVFCLITKEYS